MYSQMNIDQAAAREARNIMHGYIIPTLQHKEVRTERDGNKVKQTTVMDNGVMMDKWTDTPYTQSLAYRLQQAKAGEVVPITKQEWDELYQHTSI